MRYQPDRVEIAVDETSFVEMFQAGSILFQLQKK